MAKRKQTRRDGVYQRKDRPGYWISWTDAQGGRRYRKTDSQTLKDAQAAITAELARVEKSKALGFTPPGEETFSEVVQRFLSH